MDWIVFDRKIMRKSRDLVNIRRDMMEKVKIMFCKKSCDLFNYLKKRYRIKIVVDV